MYGCVCVCVCGCGCGCGCGCFSAHLACMTSVYVVCVWCCMWCTLWLCYECVWVCKGVRALHTCVCCTNSPLLSPCLQYTHTSPQDNWSVSDCGQVAPSRSSDVDGSRERGREGEREEEEEGERGIMEFDVRSETTCVELTHTHTHTRTH